MSVTLITFDVAQSDFWQHPPREPASLNIGYRFNCTRSRTQTSSHNGSRP